MLNRALEFGLGFGFSSVKSFWAHRRCMAYMGSLP